MRLGLSCRHMETVKARDRAALAHDVARNGLPSTADTSETGVPLLVTHCRRWGNSFVMLMPREVREELGLVHRDLIGLRKVGRRWVLVKITAAMVCPVSENEVRQAAAGSAG